MTWFGWVLLALEANAVLWTVANDKVPASRRAITVVLVAFVVVSILTVGTGHLS